MKKLLLPLLSAAVIALVLIFPGRATGYVRSSLDICVEMIVPTLFPFFVCSGILIYSGFGSFISRAFRFCMRPLFGVSEAGASAFVLGIISGYPLGALTAGQLYRGGYITKTEAERLCAFCSNSGPLFIIGSVGAALYSSTAIGVMLYGIHILAAVTVGVIFRFYKRGSYIAPPAVMTVPERNAGEIISEAMSGAVRNMLSVCGAVVFFGAAGRLLLDILPLKGVFYALAAGMAEFTNGAVSTAALDIDTGAKLVMTAFIVGFAGLSVHAQTAAVTAGYGLSLVPYIVGKLLHALIAAAYTAVAVRFITVTEPAFAPCIGGGFCVSSVIVLAAAGAAVLAGVIWRTAGADR